MNLAMEPISKAVNPLGRRGVRSQNSGVRINMDLSSNLILSSEFPQIMYKFPIAIFIKKKRKVETFRF